MQSANVLQGVTTKDVVNMLNVTSQNNEQTNTSQLKELSEKTVKTGMIMDSATLSEELEEKNENMQMALENNRIAQIQAMMAARKQKVREYNIGRNDKCPCGSGKKYKNCCLHTGKYEKLVDAK